MRHLRSILDIFLGLMVFLFLLGVVRAIAGDIAAYMLFGVACAGIIAHFYNTKVGIGPTRDGLDD